MDSFHGGNASSTSYVLQAQHRTTVSAPSTAFGEGVDGQGIRISKKLNERIATHYTDLLKSIDFQGEKVDPPRQISW